MLTTLLTFPSSYLRTIVILLAHHQLNHAVRRERIAGIRLLTHDDPITSLGAGHRGPR